MYWSFGVAPTPSPMVLFGGLGQTKTPSRTGPFRSVPIVLQGADRFHRTTGKWAVARSAIVLRPFHGSSSIVFRRTQGYPCLSYLAFDAPAVHIPWLAAAEGGQAT